MDNVSECMFMESDMCAHVLVVLTSLAAPNGAIFGGNPAVRDVPGHPGGPQRWYTYIFHASHTQHVQTRRLR